MSCTCDGVAAPQKTRGDRTAELVRARDDKRNNENFISIEVEQIVVYSKEICYINEDECNWNPPSVWRPLSSRSTRGRALRIRELMRRDDEETKKEIPLSLFRDETLGSKFRTSHIVSASTAAGERQSVAESEIGNGLLTAPLLVFTGSHFFSIWNTFDSLSKRKKNELASIFSPSFSPLPQPTDGGPFPFQAFRFSRLIVAKSLAALDTALNGTSMSSLCGAPHPPPWRMSERKQRTNLFSLDLTLFALHIHFMIFFVVAFVSVFLFAERERFHAFYSLPPNSSQWNKIKYWQSYCHVWQRLSGE